MHVHMLFLILNMKLDKDKLIDAAYILRSLSHETRLCVISHLLNDKELSVSDLMSELDCEQSLLSHHLTDLRAKGVLKSRRDGKRVLYSIRDTQIIPLLECIINYAKYKLYEETSIKSLD